MRASALAGLHLHKGRQVTAFEVPRLELTWLT